MWLSRESSQSRLAGTKGVKDPHLFVVEPDIVMIWQTRFSEIIGPASVSGRLGLLLRSIDKLFPTSRLARHARSEKTKYKSGEVADGQSSAINKARELL